MEHLRTVSSELQELKITKAFYIAGSYNSLGNKRRFKNMWTAHICLQRHSKDLNIIVWTSDF